MSGVDATLGVTAPAGLGLFRAFPGLLLILLCLEVTVVNMVNQVNLSLVHFLCSCFC